MGFSSSINLNTPTRMSGNVALQDAIKFGGGNASINSAFDPNTRLRNNTAASTYTDPMKAYEEAYAKANAANEARYSDILGKYESRYGRGMGYIDSISNQQEMDAREAGTQRMTASNQDLVSRGLVGTSIKPTTEALINRETDTNVRRIEDAKLQQRLLTDAQLSGDTLGFMKQRTDLLPDMNLYANLAQQYGRYGSKPTVTKVGGSSYKSSGSGYTMNPASKLGVGGFGPDNLINRGTPERIGGSAITPQMQHANSVMNDPRLTGGSWSTASWLM